MSEYSIINLNALTWHLNIAIMGGAFSVFCLIYNEQYIYYGLVTFAFGVIGHVTYKFWEWIFRKDDINSKNYWVTHLSSSILTILWIIVLVSIY